MLLDSFTEESLKVENCSNVIIFVFHDAYM
jgi:hypothetical protein